MSTPPPPPRLTIQVKTPMYSYDYLIKHLRWLETKECRATMSKEALTMERRRTTEEFRKILQLERFTRRADDYNPYD